MAFKDVDTRGVDENTKETLSLYINEFMGGLPMLSILINETHIGADAKLQIVESDKKKSLVIDMKCVERRTEAGESAQDLANFIFYAKSSDKTEVLYEIQSPVPQRDTMASLIHAGIINYYISDATKGLRIDMYFDTKKIKLRMLGTNEEQKNEDDRVRYIKELMGHWPIFTVHLKDISSELKEEIRNIGNNESIAVVFSKEKDYIVMGLYNKGVLPSSGLADAIMLEKAHIYTIRLYAGAASDIIMALYRGNAINFSLSYESIDDGLAELLLLPEFNRFELSINDDTSYII